MATKSDDLLFSKSDRNSSISNGNPQYTNLNLNQINNCSKNDFIQSKIKSPDYVKNQKNASKNLTVLTTFDKASNEASHFFDNNAKRSDTNALIDFQRKEQKSVLKGKADTSENTNNNSTLSLHITAYENAVEAEKSENQIESKSAPNKKSDIETSWKNVKQHFNFNNEAMFEIPRQQKEGTTKPEIMQFKASQKLLNPNQQNSSTADFSKLKENANKLFKEEKYNEAIKAYTQVLQLPGLSHENHATICSNRSASYLLLGGPISLKQAKADAEKAIKLWPSWEKGYYRLAKVYAKMEKLNEAEEFLTQALALNPASKEIRDELSDIRAKISVIQHEDHLNPRNFPRSLDEQFKQASAQYGMPEETYRNIDKIAQHLPVIGDVIKGHQYCNGDEVPQNYKKAAECYAKAADAGNPEGMFNLGVLYQDGKGVKRDFKEAMRWFLKAANTVPSLIMSNKGIAEAQHAIALNYMEGIGVNKDCKKSAEWYEKAVQSGSWPSANNLGALYKDGIGVEKSALKAFNYFKLAAEKGDTSGMINLANCYFVDVGNGPRIPSPEDSAEGRKWLKRAADMGDVRAAEQLKNVTFSSNKKEDLEEVLKQLMHKESSAQKDPLDYGQFGKYVKDAAAKGSLTAQKHMEIWKNLNVAMEAFKKKNSGELVAALAKAIRLNSCIVSVTDMYIPMINERIKTHPNELDAIVCYIHIDSARAGMREYIPKVCKLYPEDEFLAEKSCYLHFENPTFALNLVNNLLKHNPNSLRLLFCRILISRKQEPRKYESVKFADAYLAAAPVDDPNVPSCHYFKAEYYAISENDEKLIECYEAGVAAEKKQLPCFLPYDFPGKAMMDMFYAMVSKNKKSSKVKTNIESQRLEKIKIDVKRKLLIAQNRISFICQAEDKLTKEVFSEILSKPLQSPKPPNWSSNSKQITFKDMDLTKDKVYNSCILEVKIIDWAYLLTNIQTKVEDKNGDVNRLTIHNWPSTGERDRDIIDVLKVFRPNVKLSIINPYNRIVGQNFIHVESPQLIKIDNSMIDKLCHVCGKEAKNLPSCSGCKMALYCSKECQKLDWTEFNHKGICKHLKKYATLM